MVTSLGVDARPRDLVVNVAFLEGTQCPVMALHGQRNGPSDQPGRVANGRL